MKQLFAVTSLILSTNIYAYTFSMNLNCQVIYGVRGACQVVNQLPAPIQCNISAQGQTQSGAWANLFGQGTVYPGQSAIVYVNANNPYIDPLIFIQAQANCSTL